MIYKRFQVQIIIRIIFLALCCVVISFTGISMEYIHSLIILGSLIIIQVVSLIHYINKTNRVLSSFFTSIKEEGSAIGFDTTSKDFSFRELQKALKGVNEIIHNARIEKEGEYQYLKYILEHINVGLLSFDDNGTVGLHNSALKKLLSLGSLGTIYDLDKVRSGFGDFVKQMQVGKHQIEKLLVDGKTLELRIEVGEFVINQNKIRLVSFQDIHSDLDQKELDSWQKLIRILSHEIMSSISPVTSLSAHLLKNLDEGKLNEEELRNGVEIIKRRGEGLMKFVENYRSLAHLPEPEKSNFEIRGLISRIRILFKTELEGKQIEIIESITPSDLSLFADEKMIEQSMINLMQNSIDALENVQEKCIKLTAEMSNTEKVLIKLADNGKGIEKEELDHIFVPFYTGKKKGNGIGLSITKQIMNLHNGEIEVNSEPNILTEFILRFENQ